MTVYEKICEDALAARKAGDKVAASLLTTLKAEVAREGKDKGNRLPSDAECIKKVKKFISDIDESLAVLKDESRRAILIGEKAVLSGYVPAMMSEQDLRSSIVSMIAEKGLQGPKAIGTLMAGLKATHGESFDGRLANQIAKELLQ